MLRPTSPSSLIIAITVILLTSATCAQGQSPILSSISSTEVSPGMQVTFVGSGFGSSQDSGAAVFGNLVAASIVSWSDTQVVATVALGSQSGTSGAYIVQNGVASNGLPFTMAPPALTSISPTEVSPGMQVTFVGSGFGSSQDSGAAVFGNLVAASIVSWSDTQVVATVALGSQSGTSGAYIVQNGVASNAIPFTMAAGAISSIMPSSAVPGTPVGIFGTGFGTVAGMVTFNGTQANILAWTNIAITVEVPTGATTGPIQVIAGGSNSNAVNFTVLAQSPTITGLSETMGHVGDTITITGKNLDTNGTISFNGVAGSPSSWDDTSVVAAVPTGAQTGPVTVMVNGQTSNGITLTVIPVPNLTGISPNTGDVGTSVTISGTGFGPSESYNAVVFNGLAVQASTWTNTQVTVTVPRGATSGPLAVRIGPTISNSHNFTIVPTGSQAVSIIPGSATLVVGQTLTLRLSDDLEHNITGASWSLNDNTLAELSQDDPPLLTANAAGTVTVTATSQNLNATAQVTILDGANPIPLGTVQWSLPPSTSAYSVQKIMQTVPSDGITPDLLILEDDNQGGIWLRGLYADGQQKWYTRIGSSGNAPDRVVDSIPDGEGGSISLVNSMTTYWANADALVRTNGTTGAPLWRHSSPGGLENLAVNQDGDILLVETIMADDHHWYSSVVKIDHATGNKLASWQLPSTFYFHSEGPGDQPVYWPPSVGPLAISPEGSILLEAGTYNFVGWYDHVTEQHGESEVDTLQLVTIPSGGGAEIRILDTCTGLNCHLGQGPVIPDGEGGAIMTWSTGTGDTFRVNVTHNGTAALPAEMGTVTGLVLGESAYFVTDGSHVVAIDKTSDTQTWSWSPAEGSVEVLAATADGGVAVRNTGTSQGENVVRLNASGNPTYDTWGTNGSGYGVLSNAIYFDKGLWVGQVGNPVVGGLLGSDLYAALSSWAFSKGTKQEPAAADPALKLVGLADCTEKSPAGGGQFNYQRFPKYKLVDKNEQSPAENYTVFEKLDPHKEFTTCQKDGKNTGMSPCDYADGNTIPYREFDDEIRLGLSNAGPNGVHNNQSFVYGLPGKRLWEVKRIERYGLKVDNSGYGRIAVEHVSYLDLWFRNFSEPLIDGMAAPWMGPCNDNYPWIPLH